MTEALRIDDTNSSSQLLFDPSMLGIKLPAIERPGIIAEGTSPDALDCADDALSNPIPGTVGNGFEEFNELLSKLCKIDEDGSNDDTYEP